MEPAEAKTLIEENLKYEEARDLLVKLVQVPSPQTGLMEQEPQVLELIRGTVKPELEQAGVQPLIDEHGNLVATLKGSGDGKRLMLVGYAMNAAPATMQNPYSGEILDGAPFDIEGECVWGRGACEQKGSLAAMMLAVKLLARTGASLPADLLFATSTAGETGRHHSLNQILGGEEVEADWGILDGPPQIQLGNRGRVDVEVVVRGKPSHSSRPWDGLNAVEGAVRAIQKLEPLMPYPDDKAHPQLGKVSMAVTSIQSLPRATHTIPAECHILLDRRLLPGDDPDQVAAELAQVIGDLDPFEVQVEPKDSTYPSDVPQESPLVERLGESIRLMLGREPEYIHGMAALDAGLLNRVGIESVSYGARDVRFQHTNQEVVSVQHVFEAAKVLAWLALCR